MNANSPPIAPTMIVWWSPMIPPRAPPMIAPSGIVPHTMNRIVAFILPCIRGGVIAWRSDTWLMFQAVPQNPPTKPPIASAGQISASGANATGRLDRLNPTADATSIRPTPSRAVSRFVVSAPMRNPTDATENANPMAAGPRPRSSTR